MVNFIKFTPLLLAALIHETNFFGRNLSPLKGEELAKDEDVIFIGVLLLNLLMIASTNAEYVCSSMLMSYNKLFEIHKKIFFLEYFI